MKLAVVLFNLGGPDSLEAVEPFLRNLFSDPAIIRLPAWLRGPIARYIARKRAPQAQAIYQHLGGRSPILPETEAQASALERALAEEGHDVRCFIAMRCWHPLTQEAIEQVKAFAPERVVLLPLYPQFSTTTTESSLKEWRRQAVAAGLMMPQHEVCCYPSEDGFVAALAGLVETGLGKAKPGVAYRVLFSAHGLPKRIVEAGDPYPWQVERTVDAVVAKLARAGLDWAIGYQSRVGPLQWIGPATDAEIRRAGRDGKGIIVVPVAFVSEHSETLVELDIEYGRLAASAGVRDYIRVPTVRTESEFIGGLARLVQNAIHATTPVSCAPGRVCPSGRTCGHERKLLHV